MAVKYNTSMAVGNTGTSGKTQAYTIGGGANRLLLFFVVNYAGYSSTVTFNSVNMNLLHQDTVSGGFGNVYGSVYYLLEADLPAGGTYNIYQNLDSSSYHVCDFYDVYQAAPTYKGIDAAGAPYVEYTRTLEDYGLLALYHSFVIVNIEQDAYYDDNMTKMAEGRSTSGSPYRSITGWYHIPTVEGSYSYRPTSTSPNACCNSMLVFAKQPDMASAGATFINNFGVI